MPSPDRQIGPTTPLTFQILLALADAERHGYGIIKDIEERSGKGSAPSTGALYLALRRMGEDGLIEEAPGPDGGSSDSRRRYYRMTATGRKAAEEESALLAGLVAVAKEKRLLAEGA